jgi:hypothetical protein
MKAQKKTLPSTPLPLHNKKKEEKKSRCTLSHGAPSPPSHNEFVKKITPGEPLPTLSTMKKTFLEKPNVPLNPPPPPSTFSYIPGKKNINLH